MLEIEKLNQLQFECNECSQCCSGSSGFILLTKEDIENMAGFLEMSETDFLENYTHIVKLKEEKFLSIKEKIRVVNKQKLFDCIFLENKRCLIYEVRPLQCQTYPFWPRIIRSSYAWKKEGEFCPGINQGKKVNIKKIEKYILDQRKANWLRSKHIS